ncbi:MAG: rhodanese-like domain-containing protein [Bacteroidota bacterium]
MATIEPTELKKRKENREALHVIDVREEWEYDEINIGAMNIPLHSLPSRLTEIERWKDQEIILHCKSGSRSKQAQKFLIRQGFLHTRSLNGGIDGYLSLA